MTIDWKKAIKNKRKFAKLYQEAKLMKTSNLRRSTEIWPRKSAGKQLNIIWKTKSEKMKEKPKRFFHNFQPFISDKTIENNPINPNTGGNVMENDRCGHCC